MKNRKTIKTLFFALLVFSIGEVQSVQAQGLELKAKNGNVAAMFQLADQYYRGCGQIQDYRQAYIWYKQAADKNNLEACFRTASMLEEGKGCSQNNTQAFNYYFQAAERGHEASQLKVALMFDSGRGTMRSASRAYLWYRICADRDEGLAQRRIADYYLTGEVVQQDWQQALYWYEKAVSNHDTVAMAYLAYILSANQSVAPDYDRAYSLTKSALERNVPMAQYVYAEFLQNGYVEQKNENKAKEYYSLASNGGIVQAQEVMAIENYNTNSDPSSLLKLKKLERADSYLILAKEYASGKNIKKNRSKSEQYYKTAAEKGSTEAQEYLSSKKKTKKRR